MSLITKATIRIKEEDLLNAVWYSDGSGFTGVGAGIDGTADRWAVTRVWREFGDVLIDIEKQEPPF